MDTIALESRVSAENEINVKSGLGGLSLKFSQFKHSQSCCLVLFLWLPRLARKRVFVSIDTTGKLFEINITSNTNKMIR